MTSKIKSQSIVASSSSLSLRYHSRGSQLPGYEHDQEALWRNPQDGELPTVMWMNLLARGSFSLGWAFR